MVDAIAKRRIIEEDLYECGLDVHHYLFFVCASILRIIGIISAQNMSLNVFSEIDSFAQKTTLPVIFLTNLCWYAKNLGLAVFPGGVPSLLFHWCLFQHSTSVFKSTFSSHKWWFSSFKSFLRVLLIHYSQLFQVFCLPVRANLKNECIKTLWEQI